jgi:hypothetical protein
MRRSDSLALWFALAALAGAGCSRDATGPSLALAPATADLAAGGNPLSLAATLTGSGEAIAWSLSPQVGALSQASGASNVYTPPRDLAAPVDVQVTASAGGASASARLHLTPPVEPADYLGPILTLEDPAPGAMLQIAGEGPVQVPVRGRVCDAVHALASLQIGGTSLAPGPGAPCQPFQAQVSSRWGLTVVDGQAENSAGEVGVLAQAFLRSPAWYGTADGDAASRAPGGLLLQVGQALVDDGDRATADDLATIAQRALASLDIDAAVGGQRFAQPDANGDGQVDTVSYGCLLYTASHKATGFAAWKSGPLTSGGITVDRLQLEDGGLSARLTLHALAVPLSVTGYLDSGCLGGAQMTVDGEARADIALAGRADVSLDAQGRPQVRFQSLTATLSNLDLAISLGALVDWTGLGNAIGDAIAARVQGPIQDAIASAARRALEERLGAVLGALGSFQLPVDLPAVLGGARLWVEAGVDRLDFRAQQAVIGAFVQVRPAAESPGHAGARGAMRMGGAAPDPSALGGAALALAVQDDALNQFLNAAWRAGAFDLQDLSGILPLNGPFDVKLALTSSLPPVLMPRPADAAAVDLGWGGVGFDLQLSSVTDAARVKGVLSMVLTLEGFEVAADGRSARPVFGAAPEVHVQVDDVNWGHLPTSRASAQAMMESLLRNAVTELLGRAVASFPLPVLDLRSLDPSLPPLRLALEDPRMVRLGRYQAIAGAVTTAP